MGKRYYLRMVALFFAMVLVFSTLGSAELLVQRTFANAGEAAGMLAMGEEGRPLQLGFVPGTDGLDALALGYLEDIHLSPAASGSFALLAGRELDAIVCCAKTLDESETVALAGLLQAGVDVLFLRIPDTQSLENPALRALLGLRRSGAEVRRTGVRFVPGFMLGDLADYMQYDYSATEVELMPGATRYAYTLEEEHKAAGMQNESLPPLIWRYQDGGGAAYVINASFVQGPAGYGILAALLAARQDSFMYPVPAGHLLVVEGMPGTDAGDEDLLYEAYTRDAVTIQTELLLPTIENLSRKYGVVPSLVGASDALEGVAAQVLDQAVQRVNGEIFSSTNLPLQEAWAQRYVFLQEGEDGAVLPARLMDLYWDDEQVLYYRSILTAYGLCTQTLRSSDILYPASEEFYWTEAALKLEEQTALLRNSHPALPPLTLDGLAAQLAAWETAQPEVIYHENGVAVTLAFGGTPVRFLLRTRRAIEEVSGGGAVQLEEGAYLITAESERLYIHLAA